MHRARGQNQGLRIRRRLRRESPQPAGAASRATADARAHRREPRRRRLGLPGSSTARAAGSSAKAFIERTGAPPGIKSPGAARIWNDLTACTFPASRGQRELHPEGHWLLGSERSSGSARSACTHRRSGQRWLARSASRLTQRTRSPAAFSAGQSRLPTKPAAPVRSTSAGGRSGTPRTVATRSEARPPVGLRRPFPLPAVDPSGAFYLYGRP